MKGGLAAILAAVTALAQAGTDLQGDVIVAGTAGEEVDCLGARHLLSSGELGDVGALVIAEPTGLSLVSTHRGALWLRLITRGRAAHGSMPHLGVNAVLHMCALLQRVANHRFRHEPHPLLPPPTANVGALRGGTAINVVPERCEADVDLRTLPGQETARVLDEIRGLIAEEREETPGLDASIEVIGDRPAVSTAPRAPLVQAAQRAAWPALGRRPTPQGASYFTDASVLTPPTGIPTLIFGPGDATVAHQADEYVDLADVGAGRPVLCVVGAGAAAGLRRRACRSTSRQAG